MAHTPTPWEVGAKNPMHQTVSIYYPYKEPSFTTTGGNGLKWIADAEPENAEFIVRACNARDELVVALQMAQSYIAYVRAANPTLHEEANGSPKIEYIVDAALFKAAPTPTQNKHLQGR